MAKITSVHTFLLVAIAEGRELHLMDVNNAFLHGDLNEEVYIRLPFGFTTASPNKVLQAP